MNSSGAAGDSLRDSHDPAPYHAHLIFSLEETRYMADVKTVNGYQIKKLKDNQWWVCGIGDEAIAGPFPSEALAIEVAAVFEDTPAPRRRADPKN
jgi:hypothetical protein